jgi:hypothetical protein
VDITRTAQTNRRFQRIENRNNSQKKILMLKLLFTLPQSSCTAAGAGDFS